MVIRTTEYIEREALYEKAYWHGEHPNVDNPFPDGVEAIDIEDINSIPSSDVAPVKHGQWGVDGVYVVCSVCNRLTLSPIVKQLPTFKYCPNCGAKMDGK